MTSGTEKKTDFDYFLSGLSVMVVIILLILAFPVGLLIAAILGMLKRLFYKLAVIRRRQLGWPNNVK